MPNSPEGGFASKPSRPMSITSSGCRHEASSTCAACLGDRLGDAPRADHSHAANPRAPAMRRCTKLIYCYADMFLTGGLHGLQTRLRPCDFDGAAGSTAGEGA